MKKSHYKNGLKTFVELVDVANDNNQLDALFDLLLTPSEREDIALRCLLVRELITGQRSQRDIAACYNASISKITRGSNSLKSISHSLHTLLEAHFSKHTWR